MNKVRIGFVGVGGIGHRHLGHMHDLKRAALTAVCDSRRATAKSVAEEHGVRSANGETSTRRFQEWAGGERVMLAIVFTDVVGSTALEEAIKGEAMNEVRRAHFAQSRRLIGQFKGREIKTIGDSFEVAFRSTDAALDYARALHRNTGHPLVQVRAGIHIGPMQVEKGDVFGHTVNFAVRVVGAIQGEEIWLSEPAKGDIDQLGAARHKQLGWERHTGVAMKGFPGTFTLWSVRDVGRRPHPAVEELKSLDVDRMTPLDALTKLKELKDKAGE